MGAATFSRRLLQRLRNRSPEVDRRRRPAPLSVRGLERRIVLDGTIVTGGGSVDIALANNGTTADVTRTTFDIDGKPGAEDVYRFSMNSGSWNGGASGPIDLDGNAGPEAFIVGKDLYVSAAFLETNPGGLSINGAVNNSGVNLATNIKTAGNQDYNIGVHLNTDVTLTGPNVNFTDRITGSAHDLKVDGNATFGNSSGDTVTGVDVLTVTGTTAINTNTITTDGTQTYSGGVTIGATAGVATLTTSNDAILFGSSVGLNSSLIVNAGSGDVTFTGTVNGNRSLIVNSTGTTIFDGEVGGVTPLATFSTNSGGTTQINGGGIHSGNAQSYGDDVVLGADATLSSASVLFSGKVSGNDHSLNVVGSAIFGDAAGDTVTGLASLSVKGTATINTNTISSSGSQSYTGAVTIGAPAGLVTLTTNNSQVEFDSTVTLKSDLTVTTGSGNIIWGGAINGPFDLVANSTGTTTFSGAIGNSSALTSLTTDAGGTTQINGGSVVTSGDQAYGDGVSLGANTVLTSQAGEVDFLGTVAGNSRSLQIQGSAVFGDAAGDAVTGLTTLLVTGSTEINTSTVTSSGSQTYQGAVTIGSAAGTATLTTTNSVVSFADTVTLVSNLTVTTGSGPVTFFGKVDGPRDLIVNSTGNTAFLEVVGSTTALHSVTTNAGGKTFLNGGSVATQADQTYGDNVSLGADSLLTSLAGSVAFLGTLSGNSKSLTIEGNAAFGDAAGDTVTGLSSLFVSGTTTINTATVTSTGSQTYSGAVTIGAAAGTATLTTTDSAVAFNDTVTLVSNLTVTTGSGPVAFSGKVDGPWDLVVNSTGDTTFSEAVGSTTPLHSLTTNAGGGTFLNGGSVTTKSGQTYGDSVSLGANTIVTSLAGVVTFLGTVTGNTHSLEIEGDAVFGDAPLDQVTGLSALHVSGTSEINTSEIESTGSQTYDGDVTLGTNVTLIASLTTFNGKVIGANHSLFVDGDAVLGDAAGDTVTGLTTLEVVGACTINTSTVTTSGTQSYDGATTIGSPAGTATLTTTNSAVLFASTLTLLSNLTVSTGSGSVTFSGEIDGPWDLIVNSSGATTFSAAVGSLVPLHSLTTNAGGTTFLSGGSVATQADQTYGDNVSLGANTILTSLSGTARLLGTVTGNARSLEIDGNAVFGDQAGDTVTGLASLLVHGTTTINTTTITSSGSQTYIGAVTIGTPAGLVTLTTTDSPVVFGSTTTLQSDLTVISGSGNITWGGAINGPFNLVAHSTGSTIFNGPVGNLTPLASVTTNAGGTTQINGGGVHTSGNQLYHDDVQIGPGTQLLDGDVIHFFGGVDGREVRQGDLNITSANAVLFDKPVGALRDPGSLKVHAVDITFAAGTFIEVGKSAAESVHIVATGTLVLPTGFVVRAAYNGTDYDGVANTFLPRPEPGTPDTALVDLPKDRPVFSSKQNLDQSTTGTIDLTIGNTGERGLRVFVDWGDPATQANRFEGPGGWANGDGKGDNNAPGDLYAIEGGSTISLTHTYTPADVQAQLKIDNNFDVKYAVYQHESIVIEAARVEQGAQSLGTPGGPLTVLTTTMVYQNAADPRFEPPPPGTAPDLVNGTAAINLSPGSGGVPFEFPVQRPELVVMPVNDARPPEPLVTFQQVTKDEGSASSPVVGREQRFVLRLLSPDPTAPPLAEVELPPDSFQADRLQRLFKELPDGAYEIDLLLGENTERPILRFDIRQGRPVVPQESLDGGQLKLEDIQDALKKHSQPTPDSSQPPVHQPAPTEKVETTTKVHEATESAEVGVIIDADQENSSQAVRAAVTMSSRLEWQLRRRTANQDASLTLASRLARRLST